MRSVLLLFVIIGAVLCFVIASLGITLHDNHASIEQLRTEITSLRKDVDVAREGVQHNDDHVNDRIDDLEQSIEQRTITQPVVQPSSSKEAPLQARPSRSTSPPRNRPDRARSPRPAQIRQRKIVIQHNLPHYGLTERLSRAANINTNNAIQHFKEITR